MFSRLLLIYLIQSVSAEEPSDASDIIPRCSDTSGTRMTFTPVEGYLGRYTAELCTERNKIRQEWMLHLRYFDTPHDCNAESKNTIVGQAHSTYSHWISSNHNCTEKQSVCISAVFDLIFGTCYYMNSSFNEMMDFYFNVTNKYTKTIFDNIKVIVDPNYQNDYVSLIWHTGFPLSKYSVHFCNVTDLENCELVKNCTTLNKTSVKCYLNPPPGKYRISLRQDAPWTYGVFYKKQTFIFDFNRTDPLTSQPTVSGSVWGAWLWIAVGVFLALLLVCGAAFLLCRALTAARRQKEVLRRWLVHDNGSAPVPGGTGTGTGKPCRHVLLLYARECAPAKRAIEALKAALQHVIDGQVYDIFSGSVMALCAGAPAEWIRTMLLRSDVAVLLVQSPALHCLYTTHVADTDAGIKLVSPLLGRRVVPRVPQFGDALLQFALRITTENVHTRENYLKYYIATLSELPTEILPCIVPYRRYILPGTTALLLRDISSSSASDKDPQPFIDAFTVALTEFTDYAKENQEYLMQELMIIDT